MFRHSNHTIIAIKVHTFKIHLKIPLSDTSLYFDGIQIVLLMININSDISEVLYFQSKLWNIF